MFQQVIYGLCSNIKVSKWGFTAYIDIIDTNDCIWTTKCASDISLKNHIHSIILNTMYTEHNVEHNVEHNAHTKIRTSFINLLRGEELEYELDILPEDIQTIINILQKYK